MSIFDFFDDIKEKSQKRKQTEEYRKRAKKYIEDGERIYNSAFTDVTSYSNETSYRIEKHYSYKERMLKELSSDIIPLLSDFDSFDIDRRVMEPPSVSSSSFASLSGTALFGKHAFAPTREVPSLFDLFGDSEEEYWEARRQRDEAKWFYEDMKYEKEKLKNVKEKMRMIRFFIDDEKKLLDGLNEKLKKISSELKLGLNKSTFSREEADYLKGIHNIGLKISSLLTIKFLDENFAITAQYQQAFKQMKEINDTLQAAPEVSDGDDALRRILEMLGTIRT